MKIKNIIFENPESDNELFGRPTWTGHQARQELKNIDNAFVHATRQEFVNHVRDLAKNQFGVKTRVSAVAKKAGARTATFWFGSGKYVAGKPDKVAHKIKAELESQGFVCKFTDSGWLSVRVPDDYERNSIAEDQSDDELFGGSRGKKPLFTDEGLPKLDTDTQQQLLNATNKWLNELPRWSEWREFVNRQGGKDAAQEIMANFVKFKDYVEQNNIVAAIGSIQGTAYDWDDTFQSYLDENFGIDIWELIDLSDPNVDDAYRFYAGYRRLKENDVSDEDLFGTEASRKFAVVAPDGEILKQLENVTVKQAIEMAREVSAKYGDYYDDYGGIALIRSNIDGEYDEHYLEVPFSNEIDESQEPSDDELFAYRNPEAVRVDGRAVNMKSIRIEDIIHSDYPDFVDAYVDEATFRDGTPLSDQEREELEKVLRNAGVWETMIIDQAGSMLESDKSDDDLFGASDNYTDYQGLRQSSLISTYHNLYNKLYDYEDHYQGLDDHEADQERRRDERQLHKLLIHARSEYGEDFYQQLVDAPRKYRDRLLLPAFDHNILSDRERLGHFNKRITKAGKLHRQDANMLKKDLKQWQGKHPKPDHLPESLLNQYINMLNEAELAEPDEPERKAKTQTKQKSKLDPNMFAPKADQPVAKTDPLDDLKNKAGIGKDKPEVNIKKASQADTLKATGKIAPTDDMRDMLSRMRDIDIDPDLAGYPEPEPPETLPSVEVNTTNLPAIAGQALQAAGVQNPDFHQVANLPGNMADQIRQLGKSLFGALTMTPTKRIHVVANLGGQGPNTNQEVQAVAGFLKDHGEDLGPGDIDFNNVMPGYSAQTHMFNAAGIRWMLVKDFAGAYIYCWPEEDSVDASPKLSNNTDKKQLR
jgi:hypothetical protein